MTLLYNKHIAIIFVLVYKGLFFSQYPTYMWNMFTSIQAVQAKICVVETYCPLASVELLPMGYAPFHVFSAKQWNSTFSDFKRRVQSLDTFAQ